MEWTFPSRYQSKLTLEDGRVVNLCFIAGSGTDRHAVEPPSILSKFRVNCL
jgi:hypothetical protein